MSIRAWMITLGVVLLLAGVVLRRSTAAVDETPLEVEPAALVALLDAPPTTVRAVTVVVELEEDAAWYPTAIERPAYSRCAQGERVVSAVHELTRERLGCSVEITGALGAAMELRQSTSRGRRVRVSEVVGGRYLAPVAGSGCRLFVLSSYYRDDDGSRRSWAARASFAGALTSLADMHANLEDLEPSRAETDAVVRQLCPGAPADALLIIESPAGALSALLRRRWTAVRGTGGRVVIEHALGGATAGGLVRGTLEVHSAGAYPELFEPARPFETFGVLTRETAAERNAFGRKIRWVTFGGGSSLVILGIAWSLARRRRRRRAPAPPGRPSGGAS